MSIANVLKMEIREFNNITLINSDLLKSKRNCFVIGANPEIFVQATIRSRRSPGGENHLDFSRRGSCNPGLSLLIIEPFSVK